MTPVSMADCIGLWRRTLLIEADGTRDSATNVVWLQGFTTYVDSRGFAGGLTQTADVFAWRRDVELTPPGPFPDEGSMRWDGDTLIEIGVHENYVEHWVRDDGPAAPCWAVTLASPDAGDGLLMRVGEWFGWAGSGRVVVGAVGDPQWNALAPERTGDGLRANGVRWSITGSEGDVNS